MKRIALLLCLLMVFSVLGGCASKEQTTQQGTPAAGDTIKLGFLGALTG